MSTIRIGCTGWAYRDWVGPVYARGTRPPQFLTEYAKHFSLVETAASAEALPQPDTVDQWVAAVRARKDFRFVARAHAALVRALETGDRPAIRAEAESLDARLIEPLEAAGRLGAVLLEVPRALAMFEAPGGHEALSLLLDAVAPWGPRRRRVALVLGHGSWFEHVGERLVEEAAQAFSSVGVGVVQTDAAGFRFTTTRTVPWTYARLTGPARGTGGALAGSGYAVPDLEHVAGRIRAWDAVDEETFVVFDQVARGQAAVDARRLQGLLGVPTATRPRAPETGTLDAFGREG